MIYAIKMPKVLGHGKLLDDSEQQNVFEVREQPHLPSFAGTMRWFLHWNHSLALSLESCTGSFTETMRWFFHWNHALVFFALAWLLLAGLPLRYTTRHPRSGSSLSCWRS
jgi:hypothetical protein